MDLITRFFGVIISFIFDLVASITPVGALGITIIVFTIVTRLLMTPLQISQQKYSRMMNLIQPELDKMMKKYKNKMDQESQLLFMQERKALFKKYKVNSSAGCLTMLIQLPLIWALFRVLRQPSRYIDKLKVVYDNMASVIMDKVPNYEQYLNGFIEQVTKTTNSKFDLTAMKQVDKVMGLPDFLSHLTSMQWNELLPKFTADVQQAINSNYAQKLNYEYFLGINLVDSPQQLISNGVYLAILVPILVGVSTYIFSKLNMSTNASMKKATSTSTSNSEFNTESMMKTMTLTMPIITAMFAYSTSSGLALYWIAGNIIMMGQQFIVNKIVDKQQAKIEEQIRKENEQLKATKKVVKKKVIKKVPVSELKGSTKK